MNIANVITCDMSNGPGIRVSVFVSGCTLSYPGCFNTIAKNFRYGVSYEEKEDDILLALAEPSVAGLSVLGGDPCEPKNIEGVIRLCKLSKERFPSKSIWVWTGRLFKELDDPIYLQLFDYIDVLIDGPYVEALHDPELQYRGSSNQRLMVKEANGLWQVADV